MALLRYCEHLQSLGQYWFVRQNAIQELQLSENAFSKAAHNLILKGKLNRVRGDFYTVVPPEYRATGSIPASWFIDPLMKHLRQSYYVGLLTASALHEASHQQVMAFQVITDKLTRPITTNQVHIQFYFKKLILPSFYQSIKTASGMMNVSTPEITAFDLIRYLSASGQINNVATVLIELAEKLNPSILFDLLRNNYVETSTAQRLGFLLDTLSLNIDLDSLATLLKQKKTHQRLLITGSNQPILEHNKRWNILVNEQVEPDEL